MVTSKFIKMPYVMFCLAISLVACIAFASQSVIAEQLDQWQVLPRPQNFTELYFTNNKQLPTATVPGRVQKITFTMHSFEHSTTTYRYKLLAVKDDNESVQSLNSGSIVLHHNQTQATTASVTMPALDASRVALRVELEYEGTSFENKAPSKQRQSIQYWMKLVGSMI